MPRAHASFTTSFTRRAKPYADPFMDPLADIPNPDLGVTESKHEHDSDGIPGLVEVSDDEDDAWSTTDSIIESMPDFDYVWGSQDDYSNRSPSPSPSPSPSSPPSPIFTENSLHPRPCLQNNTLSGGGSGQPRLSPPPAPTLIELSASDEDMLDAGPISLSDWIGTGKTWSDRVPSLVKGALNADRRVPLEACLSVIPDEQRAVSDLLFEALPPQVTDKRPPLFSSEPENVLEDSSSHWYHHLSTAVPFLPFLGRSFNNAWLAGNKSICFPHLPGKHYPLWTENFLSEIKTFIDKRNRWQLVREWLNGLHMEQDDAHTDLLDRCWRVLGYLPWDGVVAGLSPAVHLTSQDLASFLSSDWLNDDMINAGVDYILRRMEPWSRIRILNCLFIQSLANAHAAGGCYHPPKYSPIEKAIWAGTVDTIYFPLHVAGNHWTLLKIDLVSRTIAFADSLGGSPPLEELALVRWWLKSLLPDSPSFSLVAPNFLCPRQRDSHSCGIIVLSILVAMYVDIRVGLFLQHILGTILLDYDAWTPDHAACHRIQWFLNISEPFAIPLELEFDDTDSEFNIVDGPTTTPEPSDFEDLTPSDLDTAAKSPVMSRAASSIRSSSLMICDLQLEDIDFFLDYPTSHPVDELPNQLISSYPPSTADFYASSDGEDSDSDSHESQARHRVRRTDGPKAGSSWAHQKELKYLAATDPEFQASTTRLGAFRDKILEDDPLAEFDDTDVCRVRCSRCSTWIAMRVLYDLVRWQTHHATAKCAKNSKTGLSTPSLFSLGFTKKPPPSSPSTVVAPPRRSITLPCPGLARESDNEIATYMARSSVTGGGAPSRPRLAMDLFGVKYSELDSSEQRTVLRREMTLQKWKLGRAVGAVFSASCLRDVSTLDGDEPRACDECQGLYKLHSFKVAIHRPMPEEGTLKYVPVAYRDKELGTLYLRYHGVRDLIELDDGRSPWLKFALGCVDGSYSSDTLTGMVKAMVLKTTKITKGKSLKNLKYPAEFDQFCNLLASTSPRAYLTFQKTFGRPGLRAMRCSAKRAKLPRFQPDISAFNVAAASDTLKRLRYEGPVGLSWDNTALEACISVYQESKEVCLILGSTDGAIRVTENDDLDALFETAKLNKADKLRVWLLSIPFPKIPPILIAAMARGSSTKAKDLAQRHSKLAQLLHEHSIHPISLSSDGAEVERAAQRMIAESAPSYFIYVIPNATPGCEITLKIPLYYGHHPTIIIQDSKHALKTAHNQIMTGARVLVLAFFVIIYTFIWELAKNIASPLYVRDVEKQDKQDDLAAARLFSGNTLDFHLKNYPDQTGVSIYLFIFGELVDAWQNRNISHRDRAKMVLRARLFLMAWRSHLESHPDQGLKTQFISSQSYDIFMTICDGLLSLIIAYRKYYPLYPLLPWLHSTEVCEHFFGMLRQLKKDFNYADVLYLERKLRVLMMGAFANLSADQQANQTSSGYHYTYFKTDDLDTAVLMQYPTDEELANTSTFGFDEAAQLLKTIMELLALYESVPLKSSKDEETLEACEMALAADDLDKSLTIANLPDSTEESLDMLSLDIEAILAIPTKTAAKAVRQHGRLSVNMMKRTAPGADLAGPSLRESLLQRLAAAVPLSATRAKTTGVDRYVRHAGTFGGYTATANVRVQNKATVKSVAASQFVTARAKALNSFQWIHKQMYIANIMELNPLHQMLAGRCIASSN
ncbi:hypothetical protein B0H19DRAFT_1071772 [Mycena capillaripes]|nr:hypothetical protein B0H19DRAFT_1071772 [Mycena capillaripes]